MSTHKIYLQLLETHILYIKGLENFCFKLKEGSNYSLGKGLSEFIFSSPFYLPLLCLSDPNKDYSPQFLCNCQTVNISSDEVTVSYYKFPFNFNLSLLCTPTAQCASVRSSEITTFVTNFRKLLPTKRKLFQRMNIQSHTKLKFSFNELYKKKIKLFFPHITSKALSL